MKKFRLIKEYPGSVELGTIMDDCDLPILQKYFTKHPEFWQEVIEKDYEIISEITKYDPKNDYKAVGSRIVSVKRLSDGEVFTVGDKIKTNKWGSEKTLNSISTIGETTSLKNGLWFNYEDGSQHFSHTIKIKQPIFLTHDGEDIFDGDKVWYVNRENFYHDYIIVSKETKFCSDTRAYFLTREEAEDYIIRNKPSLSIEDFWEITFMSTSNFNKSDYMRDLVKKRLGIK